METKNRFYTRAALARELHLPHASLFSRLNAGEVLPDAELLVAHVTGGETANPLFLVSRLAEIKAIMSGPRKQGPKAESV